MVVALGERHRLADEVCEAALSTRMVAVGDIAVAHEPPQEGFLLVAGFQKGRIRPQLPGIVLFGSRHLRGLLSLFSRGRRWRHVSADRHSDGAEPREVPRICLAAPERGQPGAGHEAFAAMLFDYVSKQLYWGCQWKELPIEKDANGRQGIHYTRVWRAFRRWEVDGCFDAIFQGTVLTLHRADLLDVSVIHGDGARTAAKKGGDNIGFSGRKKLKGDKVVAFCDWNCNVIAPFISAPGNYN
jgi:hypothetical protein